jgi:uncharacterized repeat protein (TIGR03843 family)
VPAPELTDLLERGELSVKGRMPWSSNGTFLVELCGDGAIGLGVYKPLRGERPLWDFPEGVCTREVAAYLLSDALGWDVVPETVWRDDAALPMGPGSLQRFIDADFEQHYYTMYEEESGKWHAQLRRLAVFDLLANSTDRKSGHCIVDHDDHVWAIDNSLTFHAEFKLRTVIWEFGGESIPRQLLRDVHAFIDRGIPETLAEMLDPFERDALLARARAIVSDGCYPIDGTGRRYPWPLV